MMTIKIEIGFDKNSNSIRKKKDPDIQKAVFHAALLDSMVWMTDTALLLKFFYNIPLYPFGVFFIVGAFLLYFAYLIIKTQILTRKYGKKIYKEEFRHTGILLAAVSAVILLLFIVISYI